MLFIFIIVVGGPEWKQFVLVFVYLWFNLYVQFSKCNKVCQWLATGRWSSSGTLISSTNKTDRHDIHVTEILLKVALNTITQTNLNSQKRVWI